MKQQRIRVSREVCSKCKWWSCSTTNRYCFWGQGKVEDEIPVECPYRTEQLVMRETRIFKNVCVCKACEHYEKRTYEWKDKTEISYECGLDDYARGHWQRELFEKQDIADLCKFKMEHMIMNEKNGSNVMEETKCPECGGCGQVMANQVGNYAMFTCNTCKGEGKIKIQKKEKENV